MPGTLIIFAHPAFERSIANRTLLQAASTTPGVTIHDLYEAYPDFLIDVAAEQKRLASHDRIVLQHPLFWYSPPAILKEWLDLVLQYRWAYGEGGHALHGRILAQAVTTGGPAESYQPGGSNHFTLRQFLAPFEQTARLCGMPYAQAFSLHHCGTLTTRDLDLAAHHYQDWLFQLASDHPPLWMSP